MVDLLLDSAQVENERLVLNPQPMDLCDLVHDVASPLEELARAAGCALDLSDCHPVKGTWDRVRLEQVVHNLLTNAIKYGGGKVEVHTYETGEARIVVRDNGRGIAPEDHERIFEPYERVHVSGNEEGAGLGLYIVREIVRAHGGRIAVESAAGQGATFVVTLPTTTITGAQAGGKQA
jgi:signal transduction histidine kinase